MKQGRQEGSVLTHFYYVNMRGKRTRRFAKRGFTDNGALIFEGGTYILADLLEIT